MHILQSLHKSSKLFEKDAHFLWIFITIKSNKTTLNWSKNVCKEYICEEYRINRPEKVFWSTESTVLTKRRFEDMQQIYRRPPMPKCDFNKVFWNRTSAWVLCNFIEIALRHGRSPLNLLHIFSISFPRNTSGWLLLNNAKFWTKKCKKQYMCCNYNDTSTTYFISNMALLRVRNH